MVRLPLERRRSWAALIACAADHRIRKGREAGLLVDGIDALQRRLHVGALMACRPFQAFEDLSIQASMVCLGATLQAFIQGVRDCFDGDAGHDRPLSPVMQPFWKHYGGKSMRN